jgi:TPR repeat protein
LIYSGRWENKKALKWVLKSAKQDHAKAQYFLAISYSLGDGVIQSNKKSYIWSSIASLNGVEGASDFRNDIAMKLSQETLDEAQYEASELYNKIIINSNK